ncbi:flagellar hook-length control protein FliK [Pseudomonas aeruginosa]
MPNSAAAVLDVLPGLSPVQAPSAKPADSAAAGKEFAKQLASAKDNSKPLGSATASISTAGKQTTPAQDPASPSAALQVPSVDAAEVAEQPTVNSPINPEFQASDDDSKLPPKSAKELLDEQFAELEKLDDQPEHLDSAPQQIKPQEAQVAAPAQAPEKIEAQQQAAPQVAPEVTQAVLAAISYARRSQEDAPSSELSHDKNQVIDSVNTSKSDVLPTALPQGHSSKVEQEAAAPGLTAAEVASKAQTKAEIKPEAEPETSPVNSGSAFSQILGQNAGTAVLSPAAQNIQFVTNQQSLPVTNESYNAPVGSDGWAEGLMEKVTSFQMRGDQNIQLKLNPAELGPISIHMRMGENATSNVAFAIPDPDVRALVEQSMQHLRHMLSEQGITLGRASVSDQQGGGQQWQQGENNRQSADANDAMVNSSTVQENQISGIIAGRVNLFA